MAQLVVIQNDGTVAHPITHDHTADVYALPQYRLDYVVRFNWRAMMLEPSLIEYIVVHELAHLTHRDHSTGFWSLVSEAMPDAQQRRQRLREAGRALPL